MLPQEFSSKLVELVSNELTHLCKQDQDKIRELQAQINQLHQIIVRKDQQIHELQTKLQQATQITSPTTPERSLESVLYLSSKEEESTQKISPPARSPILDDQPIPPTQYSDEEEEEVREISPIKIPSQKKRCLNLSQGSIIVSPRKKRSISSSTIGIIPRLTKVDSSPSKATQYTSSPTRLEEEIEVENSEDEPIELVEIPLIPIPNNITTILQKRKYLLGYYTNKFKTDLSFKINLIKHPINEINWDVADFKSNPNYNPPKNFLNNHRIINQKQYDKVKAFYQAVNTNSEEFNDSFEDKLSQIFDKFASPPGFMNSEFPNTQELQTRREFLKKRQNKRIARRIKESTLVNGGKQIGEFVFVIDILNMYVIADRWVIK